MPRTSTPLVTAALLASTLVSPAWSAWFYAAHSNFQPSSGGEVHPRALTQLLVMPREAVRPLICVAYNNSADAGGKGRVFTTVRITRPGGVDLFGLPIDPDVAEIYLSGAVSRNSYLKCDVAPDLKRGDIVEFEHDLRDMPRLENRGGGIDFAEINGVVSDAGEPTVWNAPFGFRLPEGHSPNGLVAPEKGGWFHSTNSVFQANSDRQKQPRKVIQTMVVPAAAKRPSVCAGYSNMSSNDGKGRLIASVRVDRVDGGSDSVKLRASVRDNFALSCKRLADLAAGDLVRFTFLLKGMPKLGRSGQRIEFADVTGAVSTAGEPKFRRESPPAPEPPPNPNPPPPEPTPSSPPPPGNPSPPPPSNPSPSPGSPSPPPAPSGPGGPVSATDSQAAAKLLYANRRTQLWRPKGNNPAKWIVVGPGTRAIAGNRLNMSTAGAGNTVATAVADYERKMGSLGAAGQLSSGDLAALRWYSGINSSGGPTSIRRDAGGGYHGEFYRPGRGAQHRGPFPSIQAAADWLRANGL